MKTMSKVRVEKKDGVTIAAVSGHPSYKWRVTFTEGGKRSQKYFRTKEGADGARTFAEQKRHKLRDEGRKHGSISEDERRAVIEFRELVAELPESITSPSLRDAVALYRKTLRIRHKSKTVSELATECIQALIRRGGGKQHEKKVTSQLARFEEDYGDWLACDLTTETIADWLDHLTLRSTGGRKTRKRVSAQTQNHYRRALTLLFHHAEKTGAIEQNPMTHLEVKKVKNQEIGILSPREVANLMGHANKAILPGLALGFFAGIRRAELGRLDWSEIDFEQGHIEIKAAKAKTASRRIIKLQDNLRQWLTPLLRHDGPVMPSEATWRTGISEAMRAAGIKSWPHNAARHSFASYHLANFQDAAALALEMGHSNTKMIFEHYRALVSPRLAGQYWAIQPAAEDKVVRLA